MQSMWLNDIKTGLRSHVLLKCISIAIFISLFFVAYFYVLNHPATEAITIPLIYLDKLISFQPMALPIYLSLWVYVVLPPIIMIKLKDLYAFTLMIALMSVVGLIIFYIWPTTIAVSEIDWAKYPSFVFLKSVDAAGNACPSLHVATAVFSGAWTDFIFRKIKAPSWIRILNLVWGLSIVYSTVATRQHVVLDVFGGLILAGFSILLVRSIFQLKI